MKNILLTVSEDFNYRPSSTILVHQHHITLQLRPTTLSLRTLHSINMATMMAPLPPHSTPEDAWLYPDVSCAPVTTAGYFYSPLTATTSSSSDTSSVCSTGFVDWGYLEPWTDSNLLNPAVSPAPQYSPIPPTHEQLSPHYSPPPSHHHLSISPQLHTVNPDPPRFYTCNYPNCTAAPNDRIFTRKSDWR